MAGEPITVVAQFTVKAGAEEQFLDVIRAHMPYNIEDPGLERFYVHRDTEDPRRFLFYEDWADRASFDASMTAPWRESYMAAVQDLWDAPRIVGVWQQVPIRWERSA
jgi:quinol monooxygenase YgiN